MSVKPLENIRVIDLGCYLAGPLAGMLFADQGAEVIKINPPGGPLFKHPVNAILGRNKSHFALDLKEDSDRKTVEELIQSADILIENYGPGVMDRLGLSEQALLDLNPNLIQISLPGFSKDGPFEENAKAYEGVIAALTGQYTDIHIARRLFGLDPVFTALPLASVYAGVHAATAAVLALKERNAGRTAAPISAPLDAAAISAMSSIYMNIENAPERYVSPRLPAPVKKIALPLMRRWAKSGDKAQAKLLNIARKSALALMTSYPCKDGKLLYVFAMDNHKLSKRALEAFGLYDEFIAEGLAEEDPYVSGDRRDNLGEASNLSKSWQKKFKEKISTILLTKDAADWEETLTSQGVPCAVQRTTQEWLSLPKLKSAGIIVDVEGEDGVSISQPGLQAWLSESSSELLKPKPAQTSANLPETTRRPQVEGSLAEPQAPGKWLEGLTVIDMSSMVAGPVTARTLAEYGANVIKIDTPKPNHGPRMTCWYGLDVNQGKESTLIDLRTDEGRAAIGRLLEKADILVTNQPEQAMSNLGLSEDHIRREHPSLIYTRIGAYNGPVEGPWTNQNGYDPVLQAASGIMSRYGDEGHPELHAIASCVDGLTGYSAMFGTALALYNRDKDGNGQKVDASLAVAATLVQLPFASSASADLNEASGQLAKGESGTYRMYQTRDDWIFVAAQPDQSTELGKAFGVAGSSEQQLEEALKKAIRKKKTDVALAQISKSGLTAVRLNTVGELQNELLTENDHASLSLVRRNVPGLGAVLSAQPRQIQTGIGGLKAVGIADKPGASTERVLDELGLPGQEIIEKGAASREVSSEYIPS